MIFNEQVMYKDRSTIVSDVTKIDQKKSEFVNLDELTKSTVQTNLDHQGLPECFLEQSCVRFFR